MLIALIGLDGAGKKTLSKFLADSLRKQGLKVCVIQPFRYFLLKPLVAVVRIAAKLFRRSSNKDLHPLLFRGKKTFLARQWPYLVALDNLLYYFICIKPKLLSGYYVISDRYFYDLAIIFDYYGYSCKRAGRFYRRIVPEPDITFVLDLSPNKAMIRAKEMYINYYHRQRTRYLNLARDFSFCIINAEKSIKEILKEIEGVLLLRKSVIKTKGQEL